MPCPLQLQTWLLPACLCFQLLRCCQAAAALCCYSVCLSFQWPSCLHLLFGLPALKWRKPLVASASDLYLLLSSQLCTLSFLCWAIFFVSETPLHHWCPFIFCLSSRGPNSEVPWSKCFTLSGVIMCYKLQFLWVNRANLPPPLIWPSPRSKRWCYASRNPPVCRSNTSSGIMQLGHSCARCQC